MIKKQHRLVVFAFIVILFSCVVLWTNPGMIRLRMTTALVNLSTTLSEKRLCTNPDGDKGYFSEETLVYLDKENRIITCLKRDSLKTVSARVIDISSGSSVPVALNQETLNDAYSTFFSVLTKYPFVCKANSTEVDKMLAACLTL